MSDDSATVVHAYGLVDADSPPSMPERGISGSGTRMTVFHDLCVVVGDLPAESFGPATWEKHGQEPDWVTPVARAHHDVLQHLVDQGDVLPLGLPSIYPDDGALLVALEARREHLERTWQFLAGHVEWAVQVFATDAPSPQESTAPRTGREYLEQRRRQADHKEEARLRRQVLLVDAHEALAAEATASVMRQPLDAAVTGRDDVMTLNSAHLVRRHYEQQFLGVAEELHNQLVAAAGMRVEVTGPWPPYNFVNVLQERADDPAGSRP